MGGRRPIPEDCGDGVLQPERGEECDDGNNVDGDTCEADCRLPRCENGIVDRGEVCFAPQATPQAISGAYAGGSLAGLTDCDGDGDLDVVLLARPEANQNAEIFALRNVGDGSFLPPVRTATSFRTGLRISRSSMAMTNMMLSS